MAMSGVDVFTVQEILGHKSIQMTRRYSHLSQDYKRAAVDAPENVLGKSGHQNGHLTAACASERLGNIEKNSELSYISARAPVAQLDRARDS